MTRTLQLFALTFALGMGSFVPRALAQPTEAEGAESEETDTSPAEEGADTEGDLDEDYDDADEDYADDDLDDEGGLRAPDVGMPDVSLDDAEGEDGEEEDLDEDEDLDEEDGEGEDEDGEGEDAFDVGGDSDLLGSGAPPSADPTLADWSAPRTAMTLHGYFRLRGNLMDNLFLGRDLATDPLAFRQWVPAGRDATPAGGCGDSVDTTDDPAPCNDIEAIRFANMRLRLRPTLALSDDVRVHMMIDVLDNVVLGSTPNNYVLSDPASGFAPDGEGARTPGVPLDSYTSSLLPPQSGRNALQDSIYVRRAWAEVTSPDLGQLRFGRMGSHWGLGLFQNSGDGIDADYSTEVDRIQAIVRIAGFYLMASYDFAQQGAINYRLNQPAAVPFDYTADDDLTQFTFSAAYRMDPEEAQRRLDSGGWVLNGGLFFQYRSQLLSSAGVGTPYPTRDEVSDALVRRDAQLFIPDAWIQFRWGSLRLEAEGTVIAGSVANLLNEDFQYADLNLLQFGFAFEGEYRLLDDKLAIRLYTGVATGDADVNGLSQNYDGQGTLEGNLLAQQGGDQTASAFSFNPAYRIDMILFRRLLGTVSSAWYLKPGLGYDIIRTPFGQLFGARADMIFSRAMNPVQVYGDDQNLGVELNFSLYYRSEDGPSFVDGFWAEFQYGVLFPLDGLGYRSFGSVTEIAGGNPELSNAQLLRLLLGVEF